MINMPDDHSVAELGIARKANFLPPWLWFWLLLYIGGFFHSFTNITIDIGIIFADSKNITPNDALIRARSISEFIPLLAVFAGMLLVFLPWVRACWLKLRYRILRIEELACVTLIPKETRDGLLEMQAFVHNYAPEVSITYAVGFPDHSLDDEPIHDQPPAQRLSFALHKCRLWFTNRFVQRLDTKDKAITYATSYLRTTITVSSEQLKLWKKDPSQAQEVLLHELAHHYHGDAMIVGSGSLLETVSRYWLWLSIICTIVPFVIYDSIYYVTYSQSFGLVGKIVPDFSQQLSQHIFQDIIFIDIPGLLMALLLSLVWNASQFVMLIAAMWCAEFNADRFMRDSIGSIKMLESAAKGKRGSGTQKARLRDHIFANITHPPRNLRRWMVQQDTLLRSNLLLLLFPLAFFVYLLLLVAQVFSQRLSLVYSGESIKDILLQSISGTLFFFRDGIPLFLCIAVLLLLWPRCAHIWQRIFHRDILQTRARRIFPPYKPSIVGALIAVLFCIPGVVVLMLPDTTFTAITQYSPPQPPATPTPTIATDNPPILVLKQLYKGVMVNASNQISTTISLSMLKQKPQDSIHGTLVIAAPLSEQGSFDGTITSDRIIQIIFTPAKKAQATPIQLYGTVSADGMMLNGFYTIASAGQSGTWQAKAAQ